MNEILRLTLLGSPRLLIGDQPLTAFATNKAQALLFYLVVTGQPHSRDGLATLLWDEMTDAQAKKNLRAVLPDLRRLVNDHVQIERQTVAFDRTSPYWLDVEVLRRGLTPGPAPVDLAVRQAALDLYQGEFLSGFYVNNAPAFDAWVLAQREQLHTLVVEALFALVNEHLAREDRVGALTANRRLLALEPWSEPVHRQQMLILAQSGERSAALAQYEACRRILATEFGVAPLAETTALYEQIRTGGSKPEGRSAPKSQEAKDHGENVASPQAQALRQPSAVAPAPEGAPRRQDEQPDAGFQTTGEEPIVKHSPRVLVAGYNVPPRTKLYGRQLELACVQKWLIEDGCRLVGIFGIGGQGKTALAATLVRTLAEAMPPLRPEMSFQRIIWQSLLNAPPLAEVMQEWFYVLSDQTATSLPTSLDQQFSQLLGYLRRQRCLLILDNLESILQGDEHSGHYRPGYEAYGQLVHRLAEGEHRSCLLLTSRERPQGLTHLEEDTPAVCFLSLAGVPADAGRQMLQARGLVADSTGLEALVRHYSGNPLALKMVAETVQSVFDGDIVNFLQAETLVFDNIRHVLEQQFTRLTALEREIMFWLAITRESITFNALRDLLAQPPALRLVLEALRSLQRRSLLEKYDEGFGLQNVVLEYTTDLLVENVGHELLDDGLAARLISPKSDLAEAKVAGDTRIEDHPLTLSPSRPTTLSHLNRYALILAQVKEYVRASQTRLLLQPVADRLLTRLGSRGAEQQLQRLLARLHTMPPTPGYAAANLLHLLLQLGVDLRGYDFSQLYLRQLYLRGVSLPQINFAQAELSESVFTEPFGIIYTAVFSPDGQYLAAGTGEGAIYLWRTADQQLTQVIQAHSQAINELAFAQRITAAGDRQLVLASASDDKSVGLWPLTEHGHKHWGLQLVHKQQEALLAISFSPDGQRLTSVDCDGNVFVWDVSDLEQLHLFQHFGAGPTRLRLVGFSGDGQTVAVGSRDGTVQLWDLATGEAGRVLAGPTGSLVAVALSGDGQTLVTGGKEGHLCLWALPEGQLRQVVETNSGIIDALAFSSDGETLASSHKDRAVRLWTIENQARLQLRHTMPGHTHVIWSVAFGPRLERQRAGNNTRVQQLLASGGSDQTVRVWDAETGQSLYMLRGQPRALLGLAISPPVQTPRAAHLSMPLGADWLLTAVGFDQLVHVWQGRGSLANATHRALYGQRGQLYTVAISPDGRTVASAGAAKTICLWDVASGQLLQTLHGHTDSIRCVAFHPDGDLLASCGTDGTVRLWSLQAAQNIQGRAVAGFSAGQLVNLLQANLYFVYSIAFSPDGRILASVGADLSIRLWDMTQHHRPELIDARKTVYEAGEQDIFTVAFSPNGTKMACGGNHLIHVWDLRRVEAPLILRQHTTWIFSVAFSPDGTTLASGSADCTVCLWDVASGALRAIGHGHRETIYSVAFSPDGATVLTCSFDGTIKFWDSQTGDCINTLRVEGPYAGMKITGITGVTEAQKAALQALGAVDE